jgi:anaerobic selenocysteine-containing dehydrogenase
MTETLTWKKTHCARMDHGGCALLVAVKNNRIVKVKGDPDGFLNKGYICPKAIASPDRLNHPERLTAPLKRTGDRGQGQWKKISWTEAIAEITSKLNRAKDTYGARSVAFCQGMPKGLEHFVLIRLANLFGSPNVVATQDVCHAPREISGVHTCGFYPVVDFHHSSKLVVLWGSNITSTNEEGEISSLLLEQIKQGTELIIVDPRKTALASKAKHWLQIKPGTDNALALSFLNVIIQEELYDQDFVADWTYGFDELSDHVKAFTPEKMAAVTQVPSEKIRAAAIDYAASHPAAIQWGNPIEQTIHTFDASRSLVCLMAICGNLDIPGGNVQPLDPDVLGLGKFVRADSIPSKRKEMIHAHHHTIPRLMTVPPAFFRRAVLSEEPYAVKAAYFQCTNPLLTYADSQMTFDALMKLDFVAVADLFMTPTACLADIVLPVASHFEFDDIGHYGIGHGYILARPKIVDPPTSCWPDIQILNELGKTLTSEKYWYPTAHGLLESVLAPSGLTYAQFLEKGYLKGADRFRKHRTSGFKTPSGKVELVLTRADQYNLNALPNCEQVSQGPNPEYPLVLTSSKDRYYLHASYRWVDKLRDSSPKPIVELHPETALTHGIEQDDAVVIETDSGSITQYAKITDTIMPGVLNAAYGWWFPETLAENQFDWRRSNFNMLTTTEHLGKEFGTPNLKGISCRIKKKNSQSK